MPSTVSVVVLRWTCLLCVSVTCVFGVVVWGLDWAGGFDVQGQVNVWGNGGSESMGDMEGVGVCESDGRGGRGGRDGRDGGNGRDGRDGRDIKDGLGGLDVWDGWDGSGERDGRD